MQITQNVRRQFDRREDAERMIEVFLPAGYCYCVVPLRTQSGTEVFHTYAVRVLADDCKPLGYAWDETEEALSGGPC